MNFEELIKKLSPKLKGIVYKLGNRSPSLGTEDLYQEAIMHLLESFREGLLDGKTDSYILQGCYFYLKNYLRKGAKGRIIVSLQSRAYESDDTILLQDLVPDAFDKSAYLDRLNDKLLAQVIQNNGLKPREKEVIAFYAEGLTTRQIGERLGVSHVRVVKLTQRIREKCRKYLL